MAYAKNLASASIREFFDWINERHLIWCKKDLGQKKPWTRDKIMQQYKFTNVFRQLDKGTIALNKMLGKWHQNTMEFKDMDMSDAISVLFNIVWYRLFNRYEHAEDIGWHHHMDFNGLRKKMIDKRDDGKQIFTNAHMVCSPKIAQEHPDGKLYAAIVGPTLIAKEIGVHLVSYIYHNQSMQRATQELKIIPMVGDFVAYEIACDLRFTPFLKRATDVLTWANLGPGAKRGLTRLGLEHGHEAMKTLYDLAIQEKLIQPHVMEHVSDVWPPFELREIEHSLCEFDKYIRAREGEGRPRMRYDGGA